MSPREFAVIWFSLLLWVCLIVCLLAVAIAVARAILGKSRQDK